MVEKKVGVIILNYNSTVDSIKCIKYIKSQDYQNIDVVLVDNMSSERESVENLKEYCKRNNVTFIQNKVNNGFSAGNNVGLKYAVKKDAEWLLVINPDVELRDTHYISYVMREVKNWNNVGVIGTNVVLPSGERQNPMHESTELQECLSIFEPIFKRFRKIKKVSSNTGYCTKVSGCCFFINRNFLEKNKYLDENVFMYCEEPILACQVKMKGYKELYIDEVTANHEHYKALKPNSDRLQMFFDNRIYYIEKYSGYSKLGKYISILERKIEKKYWKILHKYRSRR